MPSLFPGFQTALTATFWVVFFFAFVVEGRIVRPAMTSQESRQDQGTCRALMIGSPLTLLAAIAASYLPWLSIPFPILSLSLGIALLVAGTILRRYCMRTLGASFTGKVIVRKDQPIIQTGIYHYIRHPSYTAAFFLFVGVGLGLGNWLSLAILFLAHCYLYGRRVLVEEAALVETLGEPYLNYMAKTRRFIPFIY